MRNTFRIQFVHWADTWGRTQHVFLISHSSFLISLPVPKFVLFLTINKLRKEKLGLLGGHMGPHQRGIAVRLRANTLILNS